MRTWQRYWARNLIAVLVGVVVFTLANLSPLLWDSALLAGWDVGVITWLVLTFVVIKGADVLADLGTIASAGARYSLRTGHCCHHGCSGPGRSRCLVHIHGGAHSC